VFGAKTMTLSLALDKEIEGDIRMRWLAIFKPEDLNLTPEQVFHNVNFLIFQLDRFQKGYEDLKAEATGDAQETAQIIKNIIRGIPKQEGQSHWEIPGAGKFDLEGNFIE
jgi:hypothetical protein